MKTQGISINIERDIFSWNSSPKIWSSWAKDWGKSIQAVEETNWFNTFSVVYSWSAKEKSLGRERSSKSSSPKEEFNHHEFSVIGCVEGYKRSICVDNPLEIVIYPFLHPIKSFVIANHGLPKIIGCPLEGSFDSTTISWPGIPMKLLIQQCHPKL